MEHVEIGPTPAGESCAQVGQADYPERSRRECLVFKRMLQRLFPVPDGLNVRYVTRSHQHDYGTYREVAVEYGGDSVSSCEAAAEFALHVERNTPDTWDTVSTYELAWFERKDAISRAVRAGEMDLSAVPSHYGNAEPPALAAESSFRELIEAFPL